MSAAELRYHPEARKELIEAARYFEGREAGLGSRFLDEVERAESFVARHPKTWPPDSSGRRKQPVHVFPYSLIYRFEEGTVYILAVAHGSRRPGYWEERDS